MTARKQIKGREVERESVRRVPFDSGCVDPYRGISVTFAHNGVRIHLPSLMIHFLFGHKLANGATSASAWLLSLHLLFLPAGARADLNEYRLLRHLMANYDSSARKYIYFIDRYSNGKHVPGFAILSMTSQVQWPIRRCPFKWFSACRFTSSSTWYINPIET